MEINSTRPLRRMTNDKSILSALRNVINPRKPQRICLDRRGCVVDGKRNDYVWTTISVRK